MRIAAIAASALGAVGLHAQRVLLLVWLRAGFDPLPKRSGEEA